MKKFSYNPINEDFIDAGYQGHADSLYNAGQQKNFDNYIRGILKGNILYLRTYFPYISEIENLTADKIKRLSAELLKQYKKDILKAIKKHYNIISDFKIVFNADNDLLKKDLQTNFI